MSSYLRTIALLLVFGPIFAMLAEPFFAAIFDYLEWDTEDWAVPAVSFLAEIIASYWFRVCATLAIGFGIGVWGHWVATRFDSSSKNSVQIKSTLPMEIEKRSNDTSWKDIYQQRPTLNIREAACLLAGESPPSAVVSDLETAYEGELESAIKQRKIKIEIEGRIPLMFAALALPEKREEAISKWLAEKAVDDLWEIQTFRNCRLLFQNQTFLRSK